MEEDKINKESIKGAGSRCISLFPCLYNSVYKAWKTPDL